jgi:O-antigen ligase
VTNLAAGATLMRSLWAVQHDLRTFAFVLLLWPVFAVERLARFALWALVWAFAAVAGVNWIATLAGVVPPGKYLWPTMHHLHGQMSVGCIFLLAQLMLTRNRLSWQAVIPMAVLLGAMFMANERRAGFLLLVAGLPLWIFLNRQRFSVGRFRWLFIVSGVAVLIMVASSSIVQSRLLLVWHEVTQYLQRPPLERANDFSSVGLRLQFYASIVEIIKEHWLMGVGSLHFAEVFQQINLAMGTTEPQRFTNPHNEYLFMLATKGVLGLVLYVGIFVQACRLVSMKTSELQRIGLYMFVYLFMVSIFMNSMMVDMEEGHFTMLIILIFLAPSFLELLDDGN